MAATAVLNLLCPTFRKPPRQHSISFSTSSPASDVPTLISTVASLLLHHRSKSRWSHLRSLLSSADPPLSPTHFSQIAVLIKSNPHLALRFFFFSLQNPSLFTHNLHSFSTLIHILSRARLKARARSVIRAGLGRPALFNPGNEDTSSEVQFFYALLKTYRECDSAPFVFDLLIKSCLESKKTEGSLQIVRLLMSRGVSPQVSTLNMLVSCVLKWRGPCEGYEVFREVFGESEGDAKRVVGSRPNVHSFNALMVGFYRDGDLEMVEEIWSEMRRFGCVANGFSYSVLMEVYFECGRVKEAEKLWEEMREEGIKPDVVAYNTIIGGLCKIGEIKKAEEFYSQMELSGVESACVTFDHLVGGYCRVGNVDMGILVYKDMRRRGFRPEQSTIDALIGGLCRKSRVFEASEIMRVAMRDVSFFPSGKSYEFLIRGLCEDGKMEEALKLQAEMVGKGFAPTSNVYEAFIEGYTKSGNEETASMLRKEMDEIPKWQKED